MTNKDKDEMLEENDFRGKLYVRAKYYKAMQEGYKTVIHKSDGSNVVRETRPIFLELLHSRTFSKFRSCK